MFCVFRERTAQVCQDQWTEENGLAGGKQAYSVGTPRTFCRSVVCEPSNSVIFFGPFQLSPKKTWEGFIGGFFSTVVFGFIVSFLKIIDFSFDKLYEVS